MAEASASKSLHRRRGGVITKSHQKSGTQCLNPEGGSRTLFSEAFATALQSSWCWQAFPPRLGPSKAASVGRATARAGSRRATPISDSSNIRLERAAARAVPPRSKHADQPSRPIRIRSKPNRSAHPSLSEM